MIASCLLLAAVATSAPADTAVVCPPQFREALAPWVELRESEGRRIVWIDAAGKSSDIRERIVRASRDNPLRWLLIVGDVASPYEPVAADAARTPSHYVRAKVNVRWGSTPEIATDNPYGDLDGDGSPELAVGRLTADTPAELSVIVQKILAHEQRLDVGDWRRRIHFVAGVGGFGRVTDAVLEASARSLIGAGIPAGYDTTMTHASWTSAYCPSPPRFRDVTIRRLNEGGLFWVYMGHGHPCSLDAVKTEAGKFPIFENADVERLTAGAGAGSPVALFLACYTGAFDADRDCLAEEMIAAPGGPVAAIAASRVSMPYAMSVLGREWMRACFSDRAATLGELFQRGKANALRPAETAEGKSIETLARVLTPGDASLDDERREHLAMFNLFGDPLLSIRVPQNLEMRVTAEPGRNLKIEGFCNIAGIVEIDAVPVRGRLLTPAPDRKSFDASEEAQNEYDRIYLSANDTRFATERVEAKDGRFTAKLFIPKSVRGDCHVRAFVRGSKDAALGSCSVRFEAGAAEWAKIASPERIAQGRNSSLK